MKLLTCKECNGVIEVPLGCVRSCPCGKSWATYIDRLHVRYDGPAVILGLDNTDYFTAIARAEDASPMPVRVTTIPRGDGVLKVEDPHCTRCTGTTVEEGLEKHRIGPQNPTPDGGPGFLNLSKEKLCA